MSINQSGGPPSSVASTSAWRELLTSQQQLNQVQSGLKVGETLQARVQALLPPPADAPSGQTRLILEVSGRLLETVAKLAVKPGDVLNLTLQSNQQILLQTWAGSSVLTAVLKAVLPQTLLNLTSTTVEASQPQRVAAALIRAMPFQGPLLETLGKLLAQPAGTLPAKVEQALQQLQQAIPQAKELSNLDALKQALRNSGAFSEKQWLAMAASPGTGASGNIPQDLKAALLNLFVALSRPAASAPQAGAAATQPPTPAWQPAASQTMQPLLFPHPEFLRQPSTSSRRETLSTGDMLKLVAQALSRIQTTQLNTVQHNQASSDATPGSSWLLELPVQNQQQLNLFQLRIDQEPFQQHPDQQEKNNEGGERKQESIWRLTLSFNLEPLGPMHSLVRIQSGRVSSTFWAEKDSTKLLLDQELPQLRKALVGLGLDVESLEALQGQPMFTQTKLETSLIDVRT